MKQTYFRSTTSWPWLLCTLAVVLLLGYWATHPCKREGPGRCYVNHHFYDCIVCVER